MQIVTSTLGHHMCSEDSKLACVLYQDHACRHQNNIVKLKLEAMGAIGTITRGRNWVLA